MISCFTTDLFSPELYGKDMVPHLSKILNECTSPSQEAPCALAIEGIKQLCRCGIVDLITTWNTLSVLYEYETRPLVMQRFHKKKIIFQQINYFKF